MKYSTTYQITSAQIDGRYRLTVDGLLTFHENTVARYLTTLGLAAFHLQQHDRTWVISEINLEFPQPPTIWSEDVRVTIWVSEVSALRMWIDFVAQEVHSGTVTARGNSCWSVISMSERTLVPCEGLIPEGEIVPELAAGKHRKRSVMKFSPEPMAVLAHKVNLIDLDFNGHTNNRSYIRMALASFGPDYLDINRPDFLNIRFLHESRLGDGIVNKTYPTDDPQTFVSDIKSAGGLDLCRVSSHWIPKGQLPDIVEANRFLTEKKHF